MTSIPTGYKNPAPTSQEDLEAMIDKHGFCVVLAALGAIAHEKAEHIETNWQDKASAKVWSEYAKATEKLAVRLAMKGGY